MRATRLLLCALPPLLIAACATRSEPTNHGDIRLRYSDGRILGLSPFLAMSGYLVTYPDIPLHSPGTQVIRVRQLPAPIFPSFADLKIPKDEGDPDRFDQPWRSALLDIRYTTVDGKLLHRQKVDLSRDWNGHSFAIRRNTLRIAIPISPWDGTGGLKPPPVTSYDIIIKVIRPSRRPSDQLRAKAFLHQWECP